jgi:drug/metabolite transporter (DMT)-like permease
MKIENNYKIKLSYLYLFFTLIFFSSIEVFTKELKINFYTITVIRFAIGILILFPFSIKGLKDIEKRDFFFILLNGIILVFSMLFLQISVYFGNPTVSAILVSTNVIFVEIFTIIFEKKIEKIFFIKLIFLFIGVFAIYLFLKDGIDSFNYLNLIFGILASLMFGFFTTMNKNYLKKYNQFSLNFILFLSGTLILFIFSNIIGKFEYNFYKTLSLKNFFVLLYIGIFVTGIAYIFFFYGLRYNNAVEASFIFYFKPFIAYIIYCIYFNIFFKIEKFIFIFLIILSIYLYKNSEKFFDKNNILD